MAGVIIAVATTRGFLNLLLVLLSFNFTRINALTIEYCSSQNTGSSFSEVTDHYQSNGLCFDTCKAQYAFAIVQGNGCWCSDYIPADTTSTSSCNEDCPGFPSDKCGSPSAGLYGYIALSISPSGTAAGSSSAAASSSPSSTSVESIQATPSTTIPQTSSTTDSTTSVTPSTTDDTQSASQTWQQSTYSTSATFTSSTPSSRPSSTPSSAPSSTQSTTITPSLAPTVAAAVSSWSPIPVTSVITVTGVLRTLTITPSSPPTSKALPDSNSNGFFTYTGKVAGLFVGVALIILTIAGVLLWSFYRRKRNAQAFAASNAGDQTPQRRPSRLSQMGLMSGSQRPLGEKSVPSLQTSGWGPTNGGDGSVDDTTTPIDSRTSYPRVVDQRLNPVALWNPLHDNGSHVSVRSFQDDQDYSRRMLRVANPDE
ncbi:hypothetical protein MMC12_004700 [Toensbergia leucococca]|nr:hypothetical protein [Toensbergia leucococca]